MINLIYLPSKTTEPHTLRIRSTWTRPVTKNGYLLPRRISGFASNCLLGLRRWKKLSQYVQYNYIQLYNTALVLKTIYDNLMYSKYILSYQQSRSQSSSLSMWVSSRRLGGQWFGTMLPGVSATSLCYRGNIRFYPIQPSCRPSGQEFTALRVARLRKRTSEQLCWKF